MIDILAGVLSGGGFIGELRGPGGSNATSHFQGALAIEGFGSVDNFKSIMDRLIGFLKATEPVEGVREVLVHGERECTAEQERRKNGIPYHRDVVERITKLADAVGTPLPEPVGEA